MHTNHRRDFSQNHHYRRYCKYSRKCTCLDCNDRKIAAKRLESRARVKEQLDEIWLGYELDAQELASYLDDDLYDYDYDMTEDYSLFILESGDEVD